MARTPTGAPFASPRRSGAPTAANSAPAASMDGRATCTPAKSSSNWSRPRPSPASGSITSSSWAWASRSRISRTLMRAIAIINAPWGIHLGARHITVSTSGLAPRIRELADQPLQIRLAISLHGATDAVRQQIMPVNRKYPAGRSPRCVRLLHRSGRNSTSPSSTSSSTASTTPPSRPAPSPATPAPCEQKSTSSPTTPSRGSRGSRPERSGSTPSSAFSAPARHRRHDPHGKRPRHRRRLRATAPKNRT